MVRSGAPICVSAHASLCAFIPVLNVGELWGWCPWFVICQVRMCVFSVSAVVFVGMQQANHSIAGHVSSVIACRQHPHFSVWKINGLLFVSLSIFPSCFSHSCQQSGLELYSVSFHLVHLRIYTWKEEWVKVSVIPIIDSMPFGTLLNMTRITLIFQNITCDCSPCRKIRRKKKKTSQ